MNKNKIIVDFMRVDNVLIAKIINTPKCLIGKAPIITSKEAYDLKSCCCPKLRRYSLYLDGKDEEVIRTRCGDCGEYCCICHYSGVCVSPHGYCYRGKE